MDTDLLTHLQSHAKAYEGLMSLTPADVSHTNNNEGQWKKKKQSKEQKRAAKRAKLDPSANKSALDIHRERELKRKLEIESHVTEEPKSGFESAPSKKKKLNQSEPTPSSISDDRAGDTESKRQSIAEKRKIKRERKQAKNLKFKEKIQAKKAVQRETKNPQTVRDEDGSDDHGGEADEMEAMDLTGISANETSMQMSSTASPSIQDSPIFDEAVVGAKSSTSSTSSVLPAVPKVSDELEQQSSKLPEIDKEVLQERLRVRLEALRAARKADGVNGKPVKSRQDLIETRRRKQELRKAHKKELRAQAKGEKARQEAEAEAARLRGGSNSPSLFSPLRTTPSTNFSFGRVSFGDGQELDAKLSKLIDTNKKKGPQDAKTALEAAQRKQSRLHGLDPEQKAEIEDKDLWLNAKKRIHGEKVRDDVSLLKKTLKRKEKGKQKSEKEWNGRIEGVKQSQIFKQNKREENLQKRKEEKNKKGLSKNSKPAKKPVKKRPGFEGSFKASHRPRPVQS